MNKITLSLAYLAFLIVSITNSVTGQEHKNITLKILETTDVHGALFTYDFVHHSQATTSLAQVYTYVKKQRTGKDQVVLLDNGDILQGQPTVYYSNYEKTDTTHICARVMNYMGYDAATVGNHDLEAGHNVYDKLRKEFQFPWLSANSLIKGTDKPYFVPYAIVNRQGVKIAILGLTTPAIPKWLPEKLWEGMEYEDMIQSAQHWVRYIREKEHPDLMIGLFHAGTDAAYGNQTESSPKNENASKLVAQQVPGFDVVFVGHDHKRTVDSVAGPDGRMVYLVGADNSARTIGQATISMQYNKQTSTYSKHIHPELIEVTPLKADSAYVQHFSSYVSQVQQYTDKYLGTFSAPVYSRESIFGDAPFVDLIHQVQLDITHADISFAAPLSFNATIKKGDIYVRDMFNFYRFENFLCTMHLSGKEIHDVLEYSAGLWFDQMKDSTSHLILMDSGRTRKPFYNFESAAGINYTVDVSKPVGGRITISGLTNGTPFDMNKTYLVALNSYRASGGGGHLTDGANIPKYELSKRMVSTTEKDFRFYLIQWIESHKNIDPKCNHNWQVIPVQWAKKGAAQDEAILFGKKAVRD